MDKTKVVSLLNRIKNLDTDYIKILIHPSMSKQITSDMLIREDLLFIETTAKLLE